MKKCIELALELYSNNEFDRIIDFRNKIQDFAEGKWLLGESYIYSNLNRNLENAIKLLTDSCNMNCPQSCLSLANLFDPRIEYANKKIDSLRDLDEKRCKEYYKKVFEVSNDLASEGDGDAMRILAQLYLTGDGCEKNYEQALFWYKSSFKSGVISSANELILFYSDENSLFYDIELAKYYFSACEDKSVLNIDPNIIKLLGE